MSEFPSHTSSAEAESVIGARHGDPFSFLGPHPLSEGETLIRIFRPDAAITEVLPGKKGASPIPTTLIHPDGLFTARIPSADLESGYRLRFTGHPPESEEPGIWESADPYSFGTTLGEQDLHFFGEGTHRRLWEALGAHGVEVGGITGTRFAVWAPNAQRVSVVGDFNNWDGRIHPMRKHLACGIWEIFLPNVGEGDHYKFELLGGDGGLHTKSDPVAFFSQNREQTASIIHNIDSYTWDDESWMKERAAADSYSAPMSIYEVHLGSWKRIPDEGDRPLSYRELADELPAYCQEMGFTHIELMPITEFPFDGSWGYQVGSYFAPTSRFGPPDDFRYFVDKCHQAGIGVLLDWVPAHFPKDAHGLAKFDGTPLYEHADPRQGEHMDWGTLIFNFGRTEVRNFLIANALFWLEEYHLDGLRVDAVASMLYLDYSREEGQSIPNHEGGRENLEAIGFLKELNGACYAEHPGVLMVAEESTAWPGVSKPLEMGGLGFGYKWNMGWMNDSLSYIEKEPIHRQHHHGEATFSMIYAYDENFMLVLSHDEVVHGKGALLDKMPGDKWQQHANLRMFIAWMFAHPGKKLLFMGIELAMTQEWSHDRSLDWHLLQYPEHAGMKELVRDLNHLYAARPSLHTRDHRPDGFTWLDHSAAEDSVFAFLRHGDDGSHSVIAINATPVPRTYRLGVPEPGFYQELLNSDAECYGGSNTGNLGGTEAAPGEYQGQPASIEIQLPPLATVVLGKA